MNFLQSEHLDANSSLVRTLKDGTKKPPFKKTLKELHPLTKQYLYEFSKQHPEVLKRYRQIKNYNLNEITAEDLLLFAFEKSEDEVADFDSLANELDSIPAGDADAKKYPNHITGILTAIFYPYLINPKKEQEIHEGRKRIDIVFQNAAREVFFFELPNNKNIPSGYIVVECKNYTSDPANPELDQIAGRFSTNRGRFGLLVCRNLKNKDKFFQRCKDTAQDGRGLIVPLDDSDIKQLLSFRKNKNYREINNFLDSCYRKLVM